ncbi:hypothetical protein BA895_09680 [Humibacillus sp. DSM 29435]|uniref:hypothetical protein n=1 Tax=Humibacillus sp. DSM 29435 TaxID=1869167 RepID=UPI0008731EEC|nr:hypothetical protein [Humibacillus sp. DSM 29435]OFE14615.1 hypothetical protein BA895_09680 [Humibacillus sp. DSM 29435]
MTELAQPVAKRLQRPSWRDSRLLVGVLLVLVAATLGAKAVASTDDRVPMWVATGDLVAGDMVTADSVRRADVRLDDDMVSYLSAATPPAAGTYVVRDVRAGELVPRSAFAAASQVGLQRVTVRADAVSATGLARGSRVDLFVTPKTSLASTEKATTTKVLTAAGVASVQSSGGGLGSNATTSVQLYVPTDRVQTVVEAVDGEAKLTLVPVVGGGTDPLTEPDGSTSSAPGS